MGIAASEIQESNLLRTYRRRGTSRNCASEALERMTSVSEAAQHPGTGSEGFVGVLEY